ncbi:MAG TPA: hypothetical protein VG734_25750 [Lacunisphaera sp.]|nr:hypothetical protein [Lacunisphaera sp.]
MDSATAPPLWLVIDPRSGESVEIRAATRGAAARGGAALLTLKASTLDPDVLAREVVVIPRRGSSAASRPRFFAESGSIA